MYNPLASSDVQQTLHSIHSKIPSFFLFATYKLETFVTGQELLAMSKAM